MQQMAILNKYHNRHQLQMPAGKISFQTRKVVTVYVMRYHVVSTPSVFSNFSFLCLLPIGNNLNQAFFSTVILTQFIHALETTVSDKMLILS